MDGQLRLFDIEEIPIDRCCKTCRHAADRHGVLKRGMHPLVCLIHARAVPYVCGDGSNDLSPYYPCLVALDEHGAPYPMGWEAKEEDDD